MIHLNKYNESYKEPLDPESDLDDFIRKFKIPEKVFNKSQEYIRIEGDLLRSNHPTMLDEYEVYVIHRSIHTKSTPLGYVRAVSPFHAKIRYSLYKNESYFRFTKFGSPEYDASILSSNEIINRIDGLNNEIKLLKNPI